MKGWDTAEYFKQPYYMTKKEVIGGRIFVFKRMKISSRPSNILIRKTGEN